MLNFAEFSFCECPIFFNLLKKIGAKSCSGCQQELFVV
ncbi:hypothetical protein AM1_4339 [Acaryochloris marina MBIC11017]|uniref:Uncharacterized protein n=1 Tax=Acaryochloris marina (strain MBIC 11017) TaxID=329726 RepID=B0CDW6_ACAM1|nr:hypothetical protein AM1_4339 [Acaryochloris marina MBIC11017]